MRQWRYTNEDANVKHLGPVAQDFKSAFGLGDDDKSIGTVDADGVALAAIQGLHAMVKQRDQRIRVLERKAAELDALRQELAAIKRKLGLQ